MWKIYISTHMTHMSGWYMFLLNVTYMYHTRVSYIAAMQRNNTYHGCDHMVVGFTTTCAISIYHH
jgi:uncharacterized protein YqhQ